MPNSSAISLIALSLALTACPAAAQTAPQADLPRNDAEVPQNGEIVVVAERIKGQVDAPQPPVATYDEKEVAALGASSLTDVLARIAPQAGSGRGRSDGPPAILVNGQRIANFREMRNYPPESIKKIEVLPEEVALRYGYPPDTRVINFILKDNYSSRRIELSAGVPTRGGWSTRGAEATLLRLRGPQRFSVTGKADDTSPLTEAERGLRQSVVPALATDPDPAANRTLIADSRNLELNFSWSKGLGKSGAGGQISANANFSRGDSLSLLGLNTAHSAAALRTFPGALQRRSRTNTVQGGLGLNTFVGRWQLSATLDFTHAEGRTLTDQRADLTGLVIPASGALPALPAAAQQRATTNSDRVDTLVTLVGRPLRMPAGPVTATIKGGFTYLSFDSAVQPAAAPASSLLRKRLIGGINLAIPLTSRREHVLAGAGDLSLNLSADWTHMSDFGQTRSWSAGLTWTPVPKLRLQASYIVNEAAPAISQLGSPLTRTFNVPIYDFTRGESVLATVISGGNPLLKKERQRDLKLSANWELPLRNSNLVLEYFRNRSNDVTASFPVLTPAIEAAFPGRVVRDAAGRIVSIDQRPVTLARQTASRLRWGLNLSGTLGKADPDAAAGPMGMFGGGPRGGGAGGPAPRGGRGPGGGRGGMMGMMGGPGANGQGRWNLGLYHTVRFGSAVLVAPGGPVLDLLGGDALSDGGTPRHSLELNGGAFYRGFGIFVNGSWSSPTRLRASGLPGTSDLRFGSVTRLTTNLFVDLGQRAPKSKFLKGARMSLKVENLLDSRQKVTDSAGNVPISYQPDYLDPRGRVITVEFRKMF